MASDRVSACILSEPFWLEANLPALFLGRRMWFTRSCIRSRLLHASPVVAAACVPGQVGAGERWSWRRRKEDVEDGDEDGDEDDDDGSILLILQVRWQ